MLIANYKQQQGRYGLPLDSRRSYTKLDWIIWSACLGKVSDFATFVEPLARWLDKSESRVPLTDWYDTELWQKWTKK